MKKLCVICGKEFETIRRSLSCSERCRTIFREEYQCHVPIIKKRQCRNCNSSFETSGRNVFCCNACLVEFKKPKKIGRRCCFCQTVFYSSDSRTKYCGPMCVSAVLNRNQMIDKKKIKCKYCGIGFYSRASAMFCSRRCSRLSWARENPERIRLLVRNSVSKSISGLSDSYVISKLGIPSSICPPQVIALKRTQIEIKRYIRKLKK